MRDASGKTQWSEFFKIWEKQAKQQQMFKIQLHNFRWLEMASTALGQNQPAQDAQVGRRDKTQSCLQRPILNAISTRLSTSPGDSLELTCLMCVLSPSGFLINLKIASKSGKYIPSCEWRSCKCCLRGATVFPSTFSPALRKTDSL